MTEQLQSFVSVIIPVFNDAARLRLCLQALSQQTYPGDRYEVIVVDNGSDPAEDIAGVVAAFPSVIAASEAQPGSYAARNAGIALAKGEIIAFTDADCIPAPDWIEQGVRALCSVPNCGLVAGKINLFFRDPARLSAVELYESLTTFQQKEQLERYHYGSTANVFTFRAVLDRVGRFDAKLKSNGDFEWGRRVAAHGYAQAYAEAVCIAHPARHSWAQLYKRATRLAGGIYDAQIQKCDTLLQRNKLFIRSVLEDFAAPVLNAAPVLTDDRLKTLRQRLSVYGVMTFVRYVRAIEKIRLKFGGESARG